MVRSSTQRGPVETHFGARPRAPRPVLLLIVFGVFLLIAGVTAVAQTALVSIHVATASLNATISSDAATVRTFVNGLVSSDDLGPDGDPARATAIGKQLASIAHRGEILHIEIRDPEGIVRLSSDPTATSAVAPGSSAFQRALGGKVDAAVVQAGVQSEAAGEPMEAGQLVREYFPLVGADDQVSGVVALWRDAAPLLAATDHVRGDVVVVVITAATIVALVLYLVFRAAQRRINRQTEQLMAAARLDALTGLLNHGTVVNELALAMDAARSTASGITIALLDVDNFRLVNETFGHAAGDRALEHLVAAVSDGLPETWIAGRYGPDELLVIAARADVADVEAAIVGARARLATSSLEVEAPERVPVTVSTGIAAFPRHAASVTELLSAVAVALAEAKGGGGDAIRIAGTVAEVAAETRTFDVLQGLVFAVNTKDRYTKRHSEDVARYGSFLATQLGLEADVVEGIRQAGLLHDVGKIGIPDALLRKPARLTDAEYTIVKQHVALGDAIVRNVANIDVVRAGVRHHHERWDGRGYLTALAGEDIPMVARILAVADAFSAMTTTRPYRKALTVKEAIRRLGDAAGSQLDERLVRAFITSLETVPDAPMPDSAGAARPRLWVPSSGTA